MELRDIDSLNALTAPLSHGDSGAATRDGWNANIKEADAADTAARWADSMAELAAEESREHDIQQLVENDIVDSKANIELLRKEASTIIADLKHGDELRPAICGVVRQRLQSIRGHIHQEIKTIKSRRSNFWTAVYDC